MSYTQQQYEALTAAIAQGAMTVRYKDRQVTYRSLSEMQQIKREMEQALGLSTGDALSNGRRLMSFSKGY